MVRAAVREAAVLAALALFAGTKAVWAEFLIAIF